MGLVKSLGKYLMVVFAAAFLAVLTLVLYGVVTGHISRQKLETFRLALNGELVPPQPTEQPKKDTTTRYELEALKEAQRALEDMRKQEALLVVKLNERRAQILKLEGEAARIRKDLTDRAETLAKAEKTFDDRKNAYEAQLADAGFKKVVKTLAEMKPDQRAKLLYGYTDDEAVRVLAALKDDERAQTITAIDKLDLLPENAAIEPRAAKLLRRIWQENEAKDAGKLVTLKTE
ncbi:MAG TPA: hypothetical protein VMZ92_17775 [Planctomycetota bacterium]|nr:hypothetical protein [Planctomycetota bacterium]